MRTACFIPVKANSERVPGKNLRMLNGKRLFEHICESALEAGVFDDVYLDSNSAEVREYAEEAGILFIQRDPELATAAANGNDLIVRHRQERPGYDYYFQLFATAPFLRPASIRTCYEALTGSEEYDSCFTAIEHRGFFWHAGVPVNYRPCVLPRSQDMEPVVEETTGLYGISARALDRYRCRIGRRPYVHAVSKFEAVDINTEEDFMIAEYVGRAVHGLSAAGAGPASLSDSTT